jgi:hypothetical protein
MNDENSVTAGTKPCRALRTLKMNVHNQRAAIRIVPISASNDAFLSCKRQTREANVAVIWLGELDACFLQGRYGCSTFASPEVIIDLCISNSHS